MTDQLLRAVAAAVARLPEGLVDRLAVEATNSTSAGVLGQGSPLAAVHQLGAALTEAWRDRPEVSGRELGGMLRAASVSRAAALDERDIELVMTGPSAVGASTRSTAAVVADLIREATRSLVLCTYAAVRYEPVITALEQALGRQVRVQILVETAEGSKGLLAHETAHAFSGLGGIELYWWPLAKRPAHSPARMHAKFAVADRRTAFISSANLTGGAFESNLECGALIRNGPVPGRLVEYVESLIRSEMLAPLHV